jgi:hypothetical protein
MSNTIWEAKIWLSWRGGGLGCQASVQSDSLGWSITHRTPRTIPLYHVIPNPKDILVAFGGEKPRRYVFEENLEASPNDHWGIVSQNGHTTPGLALILLRMILCFDMEEISRMVALLKNACKE